MTIKTGLLAALAAAALCGSALAADTQVKGHVTKNGTYVPPHTRTKPNNTTLDNYSTKGNYNPYTGKRGTKDPYKPKSR